MIVTAVLVSHDGARWLPAVIDGLRAQERPVDRVVAIDTGSKDASATLLADALGDDAVHVVSGATTWPQAVALALDQAPPLDDEWLWFLHDDANPAPGALAALLDVATMRPAAAILGPKLREWPSLRRLLELGVTISGTGRRETGLERGEYDQGQHDEVREALAVNTAGMLVRRRVLEELGGFDADLPIFGNDIDFGWRAAEAGHTTLVVPQAVVFHAEAAHRGVRRTPLTGRHTHYQERRAALFTLLANAPSRRLPWQVVRLFFGTLLRVLGFLVVRSVGEALDELAALVSVYSRPRHLVSARRSRAVRRTGEPADVRALLAPAWVPYRHGLDFLSDLASAVTNQAQDVAERRRAAKLADSGGTAQGVARVDARPAESRRHSGADEDDELLADSGFVARFFTNPVALTMTLVVVLALVAARVAFGSVVGGGLAPVPESLTDWWRLHVEAWHPLGTGTGVPAPAYLLPFVVVGAFIGGPGAVVSALMLLAVPCALWGAWRLLKVAGHLVDARGVPRWLLVWGSVTYALVPATSGAWGEGRFGSVAVTALLPWLAHAALGFADPEPDRRWRAAWRTGLLLALATAFVPEVWLFAVLAAVIVVAAGFAIAPRLLRDRSAWAPPAVALGIVPVLLAPWLLPLVTTGSAAGLLLEAGRLPVASVEHLDLITGRMGDLGAPWWLGGVVGVLAVLALVPRATRVPVLVCWVVALAAALVAAVLGFVTLRLPATTTPPSLGFLVVVLQGLAVVATVLGADAWLRRLEQHHPLWQRALAAGLAVAAAVVPLGGLVWWLTEAPDDLARDSEAVVPAYMEQSSLTGDEHGVLVVRGSVDDGLTYRVRRGDGVTLGEDEILALADEDAAFSADVAELVSRPTSTSVTALAAAGIEYVVMPAPADGRVASGLDATSGLVQASAEDRQTRAWRVDRPLDPDAVSGPGSVLRVVLLIVQAIAIAVVAVLAGPTVRRRES
ncbi:glycosyltransferase family 2 protein [Nocardioides sp. LHG3406-4]|uniref:glycosyltransferase family 2 protein n=1 Tax=Nocardioides sp. LHG3406-4 TaxID=2804575 RepID=UPI003CEB9307